MSGANNGLKIIHTLASTRLDHGGTSRSVPALCDGLVALGVDAHLVAGRPDDDSVACGATADATRVHTVRESPRGRSWGMGTKFRAELAAQCIGAGRPVIHDHGLWLATNHAAARFARERGLVRIVSPRGMLSPWSLQQGRLKKLAAWLAYQRRDLASAAAFHATSQAEADEIRALGLKQPIAVIPNGVEFPTAIRRTAGASGQRTMLFLSRIHPKKGLFNLLHAWRAAAPAADWKLVIAGPDEAGHQAEVERLAAALGLTNQVSFPGEIADDQKWKLYASADVFVLPSFSENFGLVVAEALAVGTPVITTTGTPWADLTELCAGWHVEPTTEGLTIAVRDAIRRSSIELAEMGTRGEHWCRQRFSSNRIAEQMASFYEQLLPPPGAS